MNECQWIVTDTDNQNFCNCQYSTNTYLEIVEDDVCNNNCSCYYNKYEEFESEDGGLLDE